jgi:hypothetical protein
MGEPESTSPIEGVRERDSNEAPRLPLAPPREGDDDAPPPPPRPTMSDDTKPPVLRTIPMAKAVKVARSLWLFSFVATMAAVLISFLTHDALNNELTETLGRLAPSYDDDEVASLVNLVYWSSIAGLGIVVLLEASLLGAMLTRRGGARWLQLIVLVVHAGAVLVASAFLAIGDWGGIAELLMLAGLALAIAAWVFSLLPSARRWFRIKDEAQLAAND